MPDPARTDGTDGRAPRVRNRWGEGERLRTDILEAASRSMKERGREVRLKTYAGTRPVCA